MHPRNAGERQLIHINALGNTIVRMMVVAINVLGVPVGGKMSGLTMQVLVLKGGRGGDALRFVVAIARFAMLVSLSLATFAFLTVTASQACVGHDGGAHFISQKSSSRALRSIATNSARMTIMGNADFGCGAPGSTDQTGCACCS